MRYIEVQKDKVPYYFSIDLPVTTYNIKVDYNSTEGTFVAHLFDADGVQMSKGEPLRYGVELFGTVGDFRYPHLTIVPWDDSGSTDNLTYDNLNNKVRLYIFETLEDLAAFFSATEFDINIIEG